MELVFLYIEDQIGDFCEVRHGEPRRPIVLKSTSRYEGTIKEHVLKFECSTVKTVGEDRLERNSFFSI